MRSTLATVLCAVSLSALALSDSPHTRVEGLVAQSEKLVITARVGRDRRRRSHRALRESIDATIVQAPDPSAPPMRFATTSATMRDSRHVQINLDRGIVQSSQMELTFDSTETPADAAYPASKRHGVIKATVTGTY